MFEFCTPIVCFQKQRWRTSDYLNYLEVFWISNMNCLWDRLDVLSLPCPQQIGRTSSISLYRTFKILMLLSQVLPVLSWQKNPNKTKSQTKINTPTPSSYNSSRQNWCYWSLTLLSSGHKLDTKLWGFFQVSSPKLWVISIIGKYF